MGKGEGAERGRMVGRSRWWEGYGSNSLPIIDCIKCELSNCLLCLATLVRVLKHDLPPSNVHGYNPVGRGGGWGGWGRGGGVGSSCIGGCVSQLSGYLW